MKDAPSTNEIISKLSNKLVINFRLVYNKYLRIMYGHYPKTTVNVIDIVQILNV